MPARQRRARTLAVLVCVAIVFLLYERSATEASGYAGLSHEQVVGGGAVLRPAEESPEAQSTVGLVPEPAKNAGQAQYIPDQHKTTSSKAARITTPPKLADETDFEDPFYEDDTISPQRPVEIGGGRVEISIQSTSTAPAIHWSKPAQHFPISSTIQLPKSNPSPIPRIQHSKGGAADGERLAAIKRATKHAWDGYTSVALGFDEVRPLSGLPKNSFNGWGATLVDSLDTLWIMGLKKEFEEGVEQVRKIDFTTSPRSDIPLFEVTIRYLGGLLAAYDVSEHKYPILLDRAVTLAEILYAAFDTPNRMPVTYYQWMPSYSSQPHRASSSAVLAELGTLSLEFTRLAQITGEPKYYDAIARVTDAFEEWQNRTRLPGMWPTWVDASGCRNPAQDAAPEFSFREQLLPQGNRKMSAGAPVFFDGFEHVASHEGAEADLSHGLPGKSSFADDAQELSTNSPLRKRQLSLAAEKSVQPASDLELGDDEGDDAIIELEDNEDHVAAKPNNGGDNEDTRTGREVCLDAGFKSSSMYGTETYTLGGMSDSVYEYLPKQYLLLGGQLGQYKDMYLASINTVIEKLLFRPMTPEKNDILFTGDMLVSLNYTTGQNDEVRKRKSEHLTCFVGGMFAMGGKIFEDPKHVDIARRLTDGCIWAYNSTASGIMAETFLLSACPSLDICEYNQTQYYEELDPYANARKLDPDFHRKKVHYTAPARAARPTSSTTQSASSARPTATETLPSSPGLQKLSNADTANTKTANAHILGKRQLGEAALDTADAAEPAPVRTVPDYNRPARVAHSNDDTRSRPDLPPQQLHRPFADADPESESEDFYWAPETTEDYARAKIAADRLPPGFTQLTSRAYILRPEAIESVFYMYRVTGEQHWRDAGWAMFEAVQRATRAEFGNSAIHDVTAPDAVGRRQTDQMESFWIAETLKYFYLLFDDPAAWSLDDWVLNTEAHFFRRPDAPTTKAA